MAHTVFICHSSQDKLVADAACAALEAQRIPCWIAPRDILAGEEWGESIVDALSGCQIVLLIFSLHANNSPQVRREIERAVHKEKIIVPFRIEDVLPSRAMEFALSNTHWMDAISPPMEHRLTELCATISRLIERRTGAGPMWQTQGPVAEEVRAVPLPVPEPPRPASAEPAKAQPEPVPEQARAQTIPQSVPEPKSVSGGFPRWAWGVLAAVALIVVFAVGRHFAPKPAQQEASVTWTDPATGLMWTKQDNGSDVTWQQAADYCQSLHLDGHADWRLPLIDELQGIYDRRANVPAQCCGGQSVTWHVKGNLQLSGGDWSSSQKNASGEAWGFTFGNGSADLLPLDDSRGYIRALCVRRSGG
jgi:TIR domain/Protein of unknown function (DUF1566)